MINLKKDITQMICRFVQEHENRPDISTQWREPLVGFADANHPGISQLKQVISPEHVMPMDIIKNPTIIIAYFVPFTKDLADTNSGSGIASPEWAKAYEETNAMFGYLNQYLISQIKAMGLDAGISSEAAAFNSERLISNWSHRHFAYFAGLGTFGINNMLITEKGCCGRYSTVVTNLTVEPDSPLQEEFCLYKKNGSCGVCMGHCPSGALSPDGFAREKCFRICQSNAKLYPVSGNSDSNGNVSNTNDHGNSVCGKCLVNVPCTLHRP